MVKQLLILSIATVTFLAPATSLAATNVTLTRLTTDGSQQSQPLVSDSLVAYTNFGGSQSIDIWGYDRTTGQNFPIIERPAQQFLSGLYHNLIVYEDYDELTADYNLRLYNRERGSDQLVAGGPGAQVGGVTNGRYVVYVDGGACGALHEYDRNTASNRVIASTGCGPLRIAGDIVVWANGAPGGSNVYGYNLRTKTSLDIVTDAGFQDSPSIDGDTVAWLDWSGGGYGSYYAIKTKNLRTGQTRSLYETLADTLNGPAVSSRYVVWSQSSAQHVNGVMGADLRTGQVFEIQAQGPHQNSHTLPAIWHNVAVWMAWRTGNGDIYQALLK